MIQSSILKRKATKEALVEGKYQKNGSDTNYKTKDKNYMDSALVKYKDKTRLSEATEETLKKKPQRI